MRRRPWTWMLVVGASVLLASTVGAGGLAGAGGVLPLTVSLSPTTGPAGTFIGVTTPECDATEGINYAIFPAGVPIDGTPITAVGPIVAPGPFGIEFPDGQPAGDYQVAAYCDDAQQQPREGAATFVLQVPTPPLPLEPVTPAPPATAVVGPVAAAPGFTG